MELVDFLLLRDADVNCTDRLGFSPLVSDVRFSYVFFRWAIECSHFPVQVDAVRHGHEGVQKLLKSKGGQLIGMDMGVELCAAAAKGNVPRMTALIENGANPKMGDYDSRTGDANIRLLYSCSCYSWIPRRTSKQPSMLQIPSSNWKDKPDFNQLVRVHAS